MAICAVVSFKHFLTHFPPFQAESKEKGGDKDKEWMNKKQGGAFIKSSATLVVCPASLVHQWHREIERRCEQGLLSVIMYHGPNREKSIKKLAAADVVLTTYNIISKEVSRWHILISELDDVYEVILI